MLKKLKIKFICINMTIITAMLIVIFGMIIGFTAENLERESISMMQTAAQSHFQPGLPGNFRDNVNLPYFTVQINHKGGFTVNGGGYYDLSDEEFLNEIVNISLNSEENVGIIAEYSLRFCKVEKPNGTTVVFSDISIEQTTLRNLSATCIFIGFVSFFIFFGISIFLSRWAVKPVETAWKQQKQFVADASHELKTPLTVIMTNSELLQSANSPEDERRLSENILTVSQRMRGLVENLLDLARVDNGTSKMAFEKTNFSDIVYESILPFEPLYFENGKNLYYRIDKDITVNGSSEHLKQVTDILLDNAMKYSFEGTSVRVELSQKEKCCVLSVKSEGEHIEKEDLKNIFKRFYRVDKSRTDGGSYGLGLSIAETIVEEHKGKIWAESNGNENSFFVLIPI